MAFSPDEDVQKRVSSPRPQFQPELDSQLFADPSQSPETRLDRNSAPNEAGFCGSPCGAYLVMVANIPTAAAGHCQTKCPGPRSSPFPRSEGSSAGSPVAASPLVFSRKRWLLSENREGGSGSDHPSAIASPPINLAPLGRITQSLENRSPMNRIPPRAEVPPPPQRNSFWPKALWTAFAVMVFMIAFVVALLRL